MPLPSSLRCSLSSVILTMLGLALHAVPESARAEDVPGRGKGQRPRLSQGTLRDGDTAPDFTLPALDGRSTVTLSSLRGRPVVLVFGSCTCPPFVASLDAVERLRLAYADRVHFLLVYIREAHPTDGWEIPGNAFRVPSPRTTEERLGIARTFTERLRVSLPILADTTADQVEQTYAAWPNRLYILDADGTIASAGRAAPNGTAVSAAAAPAILDRLLAAGRPSS
jgi:peroxiredoxin